MPLQHQYTVSCFAGTQHVYKTSDHHAPRLRSHYHPGGADLKVNDQPRIADFGANFEPGPELGEVCASLASGFGDMNNMPRNEQRPRVRGCMDYMNATASSAAHLRRWMSPTILQTRNHMPGVWYIFYRALRGNHSLRQDCSLDTSGFSLALLPG